MVEGRHAGWGAFVGRPDGESELVELRQGWEQHQRGKGLGNSGHNTSRCSEAQKGWWGQ